MNKNHSRPEIISIEHASVIIVWDGTVVYADPVGPNLFTGKPAADLVLITDIHGDHFDAQTLEAVVTPNTILVVPQAVQEQLPVDLSHHAHVLHNGDTTNKASIGIEALPMYNIPESPTAFHTKGRGNGYVLEKNGVRLYIAGDTSAIPEMKALKNIDSAFVPMNLPYTMTVEEAAQGVLSFKPKHVYPYHYRGQDGLSDIRKFKELVNAGDPEIDVVLLNWYPNQ
jgi:L-ascorbate metabolism protein UlaG (beta-lactamase superfamily)